MFFNLHCCGLRGCEPGQTVFSSNFSVATEICHCTFSACSVIYLLSHGLQFYFFFHLPCHFRSMQCKLFNQPCSLDDIFFIIFTISVNFAWQTHQTFSLALVCVCFLHIRYLLLLNLSVCLLETEDPPFPILSGECVVRSCAFLRDVLAGVAAEPNIR
jgi:hypothetical protein